MWIKTELNELINLATFDYISVEEQDMEEYSLWAYSANHQIWLWTGTENECITRLNKLTKLLCAVNLEENE